MQRKTAKDHDAPRAATAAAADAFLSFSLNDWQPEIIARNTLMLVALLSFCPPSPSQLAELWYSFDMTAALLSFCPPSPSQLAELWYSFDMTAASYAYWMNMIQKCLDFDWALGARFQGCLRLVPGSEAPVKHVKIIVVRSSFIM
jgi:hypothetical protein